MRRFMLAAALLTAGLSGACDVVGTGAERSQQPDYVVDPGPTCRPVDLAEIVRSPQEGTAVVFDAMLNRRDESVWQAYYTKFRHGEFKSFSVWPDDAAVWEPRGRAR